MSVRSVKKGSSARVIREDKYCNQCAASCSTFRDFISMGPWILRGMGELVAHNILATTTTKDLT
jgi:hypothetical protein